MAANWAESAIIGGAFGVAYAQSLQATPNALDTAYVYSAIIAGVTQGIQILRSDTPIRWRVSIGEVLGSAFLGYAAAYGVATYVLKNTTTLHGLLVVAGAAGWIGTSAISAGIRLILGQKLGVSAEQLDKIMPARAVPARNEAQNDEQ